MDAPPSSRDVASNVANTVGMVRSRNGYRPRQLDTRAGSIELAILELRTGTYFREWLLEPRKRAEKALTSVAATCSLPGVSIRRMDKLVQSWASRGCPVRRCR